MSKDFLYCLVNTQLEKLVNTQLEKLIVVFLLSLHQSLVGYCFIYLTLFIKIYISNKCTIDMYLVVK